MKEFLIGSPVWNYQPLCFNCGNIHIKKKLFRRKSFGVIRVVKKKAFGWLRGVKNAPHELSLWIHHWKVLKRTCRVILLPIKYLVSQHSRHRHLFFLFSRVQYFTWNILWQLKQVTNLCFWRDSHSLNVCDSNLTSPSGVTGIHYFDLMLGVRITRSQQIPDSLVVNFQEAGFNRVLTGDKNQKT